MVNRWLLPILISDAAVDSRFPTLEISTARELAVSYETPEGSVTQYVTFGSPHTITDDINPQSCIFINIPGALMNIGN